MTEGVTDDTEQVKAESSPITKNLGTTSYATIEFVSGKWRCISPNDTKKFVHLAVALNELASQGFCLDSKDHGAVVKLCETPDSGKIIHIPKTGTTLN